MATWFFPTVERESIDMVYAFSYFVSELRAKFPHASDRHVAG